MTDRESQTDEICALESIFTEEEFKSNSDDGVNGGQFNAFITVSDGFTVVIKDFQEEDKNRDELRINLKFLPPIEIVFTLPPDYPSRAPPWFTISCPWLSRELLSKLCEELDRLWEDNKGSEVLFIWTQFLKEESLSFLSITDTLVLNSCKLEKEIKPEKHENTTKESLPAAENIPNINLSKVEKCDNVGLVSDTSNSHVNSLYTSKSDNTMKDLPQEKFTGASGGFSGRGHSSTYFYNKPNQHYQRRRYPNNYGAGMNFDSENNKIPQQTNYYRSGNSYVRNNDSRFVGQRRNVDRPSSESYENHRRYEKRKPRFVDGRNDHAGYESTKHYNRRKSPVERKISDNSFKKGENSTFSKTESVENVPYELIVDKGNIEDERNIIDSSLKVVENVSFESGINKTKFLDSKNTAENNLESKRMFEKNKKYQKHYNEGNSKETFFTCDNRPRRVYKTSESYDGSQGYYNNRYQSRRGKNTDSRKGRFNNNILNDTKIETLVENLSITEIKDSADKIDIVSDVCETSVENLDKLTEDCADIKKDRIGRCQNRQKHLHLFLQDYNKDRMKMEFMRNTYTCKICFLDKLGMECTQFTPCEHVFCRECVTGYLEVRIKDGAVHNIMCPENKCSSETIPSQVRELVSPELFARYDSILLATTLDTMCDIIYCPRTSCQYPTSKEEGSKMARCPSCKYAFCIYCRMVYHGIEACRFKNAEKKVICDEYQNADDEKKLIMEQKYGKKQLMVLLQTMMSETWIIDNSKKCPHCNAAIEKSDGCNKMVCGKCNTFFCWLCEVRLDPVVPYKHYYDSKSRCYNLLFQGMQYEDNDFIDDVDDDQINIL